MQSVAMAASCDDGEGNVTKGIVRTDKAPRQSAPIPRASGRRVCFLFRADSA